jgi:hypothetical protein
MSDLYNIPERGILTRDEIEDRAAARVAEIDRMLADGVDTDVVAAKLTAATEAYQADKDAFTARRLNQRDYVNGSGHPPVEIVEATLGSPAADASARFYGLDIGDFSTEQIMSMKARGLTWKEITELALARRRRS